MWLTLGLLRRRLAPTLSGLYPLRYLSPLFPVSPTSVRPNGHTSTDAGALEFFAPPPPDLMFGGRSTYAEVLGESDAPLALHKHLARYWAAADALQDDPGGRATRSTADPSTGAVAAYL